VELHDAVGEPVLPPLNLLGFVTFTDELRPHLKETLSAFIDNDIAVKVISGDNPQTVAALAKQAGFPGDLSYVSGKELATLSDAEFAQAALERTVFGRITPEQKEALVGALQAQGQYVAMMGDGVNDVLSLKKADMGIAMESGSSATRNVADMVLLGDSFEALPSAFTEGQRIINGMKDIMRLFLTRVAYSALLILGIAVMDLGFPVEPKHNTLLTLLVVGLPTLALAVWSRPGALPRGSMLREVAHFVIPAAIMTYLFGMIVYVLAIFVASMRQVGVVISPEIIMEFIAYTGITYDISAYAQYTQEVTSLAAQTALTSFLVLSGLLLVVFVEPPTPWFAGGDEYSGDWRPTRLALFLLLAFGVILVVEPLRSFFGLYYLPALAHVGIVLITLVWALILRIAWRNNWLERFLGVPASPVE
ncbi:HAD-IC family P-type ATPase, partial [Chloroflexota bacterium]